jgi:GTPase SAR1 family protein
MADDMQELQELLDEKPDRPNRTIAQNDVAATGDAPEGMSKHDWAYSYCQWQVLPNGAFSAASHTKGSLPPGVYTLERSPDGMLLFVKSNPLTDVIIDLGETVTARVVESIEKFWESKHRFEEKGILFKRGILLWGPAGSGKTVAVSILMRKLVSRGGIVVLCDNPKMCSKALGVLRKIEPSRPLIIVIEDIEELISAYGEHSILALLDGEDQVNNVVYLATTNYPGLLGPRIVNRPSWFDEVIKVRMPDERARVKYFEHTLRGRVPEETIRTWAKETEGLSVAHLREVVAATQCLDRSFGETLERLKAMKVKPKNNEDTSPVGFKD